jgi:hypothetical protein
MNESVLLSWDDNPRDPPARPPRAGMHRGGAAKSRPDDATLIALSVAEPGGFAAIFDRHATEIHRYAARRLGDGIAEDVVGETFLVAFRRRERYDQATRTPGPGCTASRRT